MGMTELYISRYLDWVNHNTWFTYLLMSTFSYIDNVQRNLSRFTMGPLYLSQTDMKNKKNNTFVNIVSIHVKMGEQNWKQK